VTTPHGPTASSPRGARYRRAIALALLAAPWLAAAARADLYLGGVREQRADGKELVLFINGLDLPGDYRARAPIPAGSELWLGRDKQVVHGRCVVAGAAGGEGTAGPEVGLSLRVKVDRLLEPGAVLISTEPLPRQTWKAEEVEEEGRDAPVWIIRTADGERYRLSAEFPAESAGEEASEEPEGDGPAEVTVIVEQRAAGGWRCIATIATNSAAEPFFDVDGDGVPEIVNVEWYQELVVRSFAPIQEIVRLSSGI
jgi:hypothetical protein